MLIHQLPLIVLLIVALGLAGGSVRADPTMAVDFEDLSFAAGSFENGRDLSPPGGFTSGGAMFNNVFTDFGGGFEGWTGWSYSKVTDSSTPGFGNQYASFAGSGFGGSGNYAIGFGSTQGISNASDLPSIVLPDGYAPTSVQITNTTYAGLSMRDGDAFAKQFGGPGGNDADWFLLTITGLDSGGAPLGGSVEKYLADYRFADNSRDFIAGSWMDVDLSPLSDAKTLVFDLASSDEGVFGMNTPAYFALDSLSVSAVPEPSGLLLAGLGGGAAAVVAFRRRRRRWRDGQVC